MPIVMKPVDPMERVRTYHYANGGKLVIKDVVAVGVSDSGGHRINTKDGRKFIPAKDWVGIELDVDEWSF